MVAAVVTATIEPWLARRWRSAGRTTAKKPAASAASWAAISPGSTAERWTIGTCGPAACTSVWMPPCAATTSATTRAAASAASGAARSRAWAEACLPHSRAASTTAVPASGRVR